MQTHDKIRLTREQFNWTQEDMAEKLSMSISGYSKIERGETKVNLQRLQQIAEVLNINVFDLIPQNDGEICLINHEGNNYQGTFSNTPFDVTSEIEKLKLIIQHKDELLAQQAKELDTLRDLLAVLKAKSL